MKLLVSVSTAADAATAVAGGADVIDAKDPAVGALGPVTLAILQDICTVVNGTRTVTAALGDADDTDRIEAAAHAYASAGAALVKVGFAGIPNPTRVAELLAAAIRGARAGGVVAVAYADAIPATNLTPAALLSIAARAGARGVLLDTADKSGPGLRRIMDDRALRSWVSDARAAGLMVALAGKLAADDLPFMCNAGADIAGVRGAACDGGRTGQISIERVRQLRASFPPETTEKAEVTGSPQRHGGTESSNSH